LCAYPTEIHIYQTQFCGNNSYIHTCSMLAHDLVNIQWEASH
jgi:hypothetical protein